jgi:hypothetical protein
MSLPHLKLWLDGERRPPNESWTWFDNAEAMIRALAKLHKQVKLISLDHDLGSDTLYGTGYDVVEQIEAWVWQRPDFVCPTIYIHSANPVGRQKMIQAIKAIEKKLGRRVLAT